MVSSGAVAAGMSMLGFRTRPTKMSHLQACAATGQVVLMKRYARLFHYAGHYCAQVLLTAEDLRNRTRYVNARNTFNELLLRGIVPIVNENDTVAVDEIAFGDNDKLSAMVAGCCEAGLLVILSDVDGLYKDIQTRELIPVVERIDSRIRSLVSPSRGKTTVGGMESKLDAAYLAGKWGIYTVVASGHRRRILLEILNEGNLNGTLFLPSNVKKEAKKKWLAYVARASARIIIDDGARAAIEERGKSLLCSGVIDIKGNFDEGDVVEVVHNDKVIAKGLAGMSVDVMRPLMGKRAHKEAIHRDSLVIIRD